MGIRIVGCSSSADLRLNDSVEFDAIHETRVHPPPGGALSSAALICHKGMREQSLDECLVCPHFRQWRDEPDGDVVIVCSWSHRSPVWERMTPASALVFVPAQMSCATADACARAASVRHLLVGTRENLDGIVCRCDLTRAPPEAPLGAVLHAPVFALASDETLGEAATAMAQLQIGCMPVIDHHVVVGMLTRGDLRRAGVPEQLLGAHHCCECGSPHGVRGGAHGLDTCLDCIEMLDELDEDYARGGG